MLSKQESPTKIHGLFVRVLDPISQVYSVGAMEYLEETHMVSTNLYTEQLEHRTYTDSNSWLKPKIVSDHNFSEGYSESKEKTNFSTKNDHN